MLRPIRRALRIAPTRMFDVHAVRMQTPSAIRISREPGAQNYSTLAISCLMECPQTEELACERRPQTHRAVVEQHCMSFQS
jgi:hypothetical protein